MIMVEVSQLPGLLLRAIEAHDTTAIRVIAKAMLDCADALGAKWMSHGTGDDPPPDTTYHMSRAEVQAMLARVGYELEDGASDFRFSVHDGEVVEGHGIRQQRAAQVKRQVS